MIPQNIGVFDSGAGGLSVLKSLLDSKSFSKITYYGDTARVPYGVRSPEVITQYSLEALEFFKPFNLDLLVIACNTVSAYALNAMQDAASYPIIGVIKPGVLAVKNALKDKDAKILIIGTKATINSGIYSKLLEKEGYKNTFGIATSLFVPIVEEGIFSGEILDSTIKHYFKSVPFIPDAIILGCTHFPLLAKEIAKYFDYKPLLIHSGEAIMESLRQTYKLDSNTKNTSINFYASDDVEKLENIAKIWLKAKI
ncbi:MAG: glutamate racemase [Helicobacteraceae bacterium]|nr:glutamate racemase [Helicobacteraceae bacterium]